VEGALISSNFNREQWTKWSLALYYNTNLKVGENKKYRSR
jgi:hypothetical protein